MILVLGERRDPHIRAVCRVLSQRKARYTVVDPLETVTLPSLGMDGAGVSSATAFSAIWDRLKPIAAQSMSQRAQYIVRERLAAIRSFQWLHEGVASLMNSPLATEKARSKLLQLRVAARCGFRIPRTYAGNNPDEILHFIDGCDKGAVAKTATWFYGAGGRFSFTRLVTRRTVASSRAAAAYSPLIYQEYIPKAFDLRVTCVGSHMFAARILSQQTSGARIDWRRMQFDLRYERARLPLLVQKRIRNIQSALGLNYGALDLIFTPEGEYVFLEVNGSGNWMWLEDRLDFPISERIANWLLTHG